MSKLLVIGFSFGYLALLFGVAYAAERRAGSARSSLVNNPYVYALSMAVYCTAWTYYGSVGRAAHFGLEFVGIYLGPTLMAPAAWLVLRKIIRICRLQRLTSIADFISARYGKSASLGALATVVCVLGIVPYISLQIKAIATSFDIITRGPAALQLPLEGTAASSALYTTVALAFFTIIFGVRSIEATERHEGMVLAVALESLVKLVAFLAAGAFVTFGLFDGFSDVFTRAAAVPDLSRLFTLDGAGTSSGQWFTLLLLSMAAILLLPRQFQVSVVENVNEDHLRKAMWLFPLYLIIINLFVLPLAFGAGYYRAPGSMPIRLCWPCRCRPGSLGWRYLSTSGAVGGFFHDYCRNHCPERDDEQPPAHAAAGAHSGHPNRGAELVCLPRQSGPEQPPAGRGVGAAAGLWLLYRSGAFAAAGQYRTGVVCGGGAVCAGGTRGLYWKGGNRQGATAGILAGFVVWFFTLVVPTMVGPNMLSETLLSNGLFGWQWLRPFALFGLEGLDYLSHGLFWSWFFNIGFYVGVSLLRGPSSLEQRQADIFVGVFHYRNLFEGPAGWQGGAALPDVRALLNGFLGKKRASQALHAFAERFPDAHPADGVTPPQADPRLLAYSEKLLAGSIGPASARLLLSSSVGVEDISFDNVVGILRESQQLLEANRQLQKQQRQLQRLTDELRAAYDQLQALDHDKDEFLATVTHELRTPLTSIRALSEILTDNPDLEEEERQRFQLTITRESERLSRLISLVLDLEKYESGKATLDREPLDPVEILNDAIESVGLLLRDKQIQLDVEAPPGLPQLSADRDRLMQVLVNLLSNAIKSCRADGSGHIRVAAELPPARAGVPATLRLVVQDNGKGIEAAFHTLIFDKFFQAKNQTMRKPEGSGLGLAITKKIVELHAGRIWVESQPDQGARFSVELPVEAHTPADAACANARNPLCQCLIQHSEFQHMPAPHILIVDDEPNIVMSLEFLMRKNGYAVSIARNGTEAIEAVDNGPVDIVLLDIMMPDVDGYYVCQYIKTHPDRIKTKVVFLSAKTKDADIKKGYEAGADLYMPKPFSTRQLMVKVRELLAAPQTQADLTS
ncbi:ATP-binding protein [Hymenobacter volaticus]|uniref:histidine kinase n=1 Tax=Hymenobacter volaticus TaxID=2932254 RepID=A0ABY4GBA3_9BACT|nr:ATP-binding protein [Hymenobacter volaticus]UOQ68172.1 response regulator [Hymenobacter volaticus]